MLRRGADMKPYLIVYNRRSGAKTVKEYANPAAAMKERLHLEVGADADTEIVVLSSDSIESLRVTHARYFQSVRSILEDSQKSVRADALSR
jgi:hypothetical protein